MGEQISIYTFVLALIGALGTLFTPVIMSLLTERNRSRAAAEAAKQAQAKLTAEWARQDVVADLLKRSTAAQALTTQDLSTKLDRIEVEGGKTHLLVNSSYTAQLQKNLASHQALHALLVELAPGKVERIALLAKQIEDIEAELHARDMSNVAATQAADIAKATAEATAASAATAAAALVAAPAVAAAAPAAIEGGAHVFKVEKLEGEK